MNWDKFVSRLVDLAILLSIFILLGVGIIGVIFLFKLII
jgi:hypothetical protein